MLETTNLRVKENIGEVGINERTHFIRDFKKLYGLNPNEFRRNHWKRISDGRGEARQTTVMANK